MNPNSAALNPQELSNKSKKLGKCPFRKRTYFYATGVRESSVTGDYESYSYAPLSAASAEYMEEEFCDCIGDKCMLYSQRLGCGRKE